MFADSVAPRRTLVDIDNDGNEDVFSISEARTTTPKSTEYEAYFHKVLDTYGCAKGYFGYGCAKRLCPYSASWSVNAFMLSTPSDDLYTPWGRSNEGPMHAYQECAGKGICNRETGKCKCFEGFHGKGCRYKMWTKCACYERVLNTSTHAKTIAAYKRHMHTFSNVVDEDVGNEPQQRRSAECKH